MSHYESLQKFLSLYNEKQWSVIPITYPSNGYNDGKRPSVKTWMPYITRRANSYEQQLWFSNSTRLTNIGIVTGEISNLAILDMDDEESYRLLIDKWPRMSDTYTVKTGKGYHVYFIPDKHLRTTTFQLNGRTHHLKQNASYVVAPPSKHISGRNYEVYKHAELASWPIDKLREAVEFIGGIFSGTEREDRPVNWASDLCKTVITGQRNTLAAQLCGLLIRKFPYDEGLVMGLMNAWNKTYCEPPLSDYEVETLVAGEIHRYGPKGE